MLPTSDVALKKAGYTASERRRIRQELATDPGMQEIKELTENFEAMDLVKAARVIKAANNPAVQPPFGAPDPAAPQTPAKP